MFDDFFLPSHNSAIAFNSNVKATHIQTRLQNIVNRKITPASEKGPYSDPISYPKDTVIKKAATIAENEA